jgi:hypothetical protein
MQSEHATGWVVPLIATFNTQKLSIPILNDYAEGKNPDSNGHRKVANILRAIKASGAQFVALQELGHRYAHHKLAELLNRGIADPAQQWQTIGTVLTGSGMINMAMIWRAPFHLANPNSDEFKEINLDRRAAVPVYLRHPIAMEFVVTGGDSFTESSAAGSKKTVGVINVHLAEEDVRNFNEIKRLPDIVNHYREQHPNLDALVLLGDFNYQAGRDFNGLLSTAENGFFWMYMLPHHFKTNLNGDTQYDNIYVLSRNNDVRINATVWPPLGYDEAEYGELTRSTFSDHRLVCGQLFI